MPRRVREPKINLEPWLYATTVILGVLAFFGLDIPIWVIVLPVFSLWGVSAISWIFVFMLAIIAPLINRILNGPK